MRSRKMLLRSEITSHSIATMNRAFLQSSRPEVSPMSNMQIVQVLEPHIVGIKLMRMKNINPARKDDDQYKDEVAGCVRKKVKRFLEYLGQ